LKKKNKIITPTKSYQQKLVAFLFHVLMVGDLASKVPFVNFKSFGFVMKTLTIAWEVWA
jgi:hypothetical protein